MSHAGDEPLEIQLPSEDPTAWSGVLMEGFGCDVQAGQSVREFLVASLGLDGDYVDGRLSAIFLNGQPVDDIDQAYPADGDVLALSAALPGAAGICMRRNSPYAALRGDITHGRGRPPSASDVKTGRIAVKLFNAVLLDLGPETLAAGARLPWLRVRKRLRLSPRAVLAGKTALEAGRSVTLEALADREEAFPGEEILLRVGSRGGERLDRVP